MTKFSAHHIANSSPWPFLMSLSLFNLFASLIGFFIRSEMIHDFELNLIVMIMILIGWSRDISRESLLEGTHTEIVFWGLKLGMIFFIMSEVLFFFSFFWSFLHLSLSPSLEMGAVWPPKGLVAINPFTVPLLNTIILLSSGITVTWSHHSSLKIKGKAETEKSLLITFFLGVYFTFFQVIEFFESSFSISDSAFGAIFFMGTSFHGLHVIIGGILLLICFCKIFFFSHFQEKGFLFFELSIWYWHFVDVVWMFLFVIFYWWSW